MLRYAGLVATALFVAPLAIAQQPFDVWPPHDYLLKSLVEAVPKYLESFHEDTGHFGADPWTCQDQNVIFPMAAAWSIEDPNNPWFHKPELLNAIAKGGEVLTREMDAEGKWTFRKKDNSTWGQIHMPWTYSRWIRAYQLTRDALPAASRDVWEKGLKLGFTGIRTYMDGKVQNIPTHHAMALYIAGVCFENEDWKQAAKAFMAKVVSEQDPVGFWTEHFGPVVGYNLVYVDALGTYYHFTKDPVVLEALARAAHFHASTLWPDGSPVACIDERQLYHKGVDLGNVGFSWTPEGRGLLLKQLSVYNHDAVQNVEADWAASMLLFGGGGDAAKLASDADVASIAIGASNALVQRSKPWQWALSAYACKPIENRWIQDRANLLDIYHDASGLIAGGGNTKLQPYWSTFSVGEPALLQHTPGDEAPKFVPEIELRWTPDEAVLTYKDGHGSLALKYGDVACVLSVAANEDQSLSLTYHAPKGLRVEGHLPLLNRADEFTTGLGQPVKLAEEGLLMGSDTLGEFIVYNGFKITIPKEAKLRWPVRPHNPYKKDGSAALESAKLVIALPFDNVEDYTLNLSRMP